MYYSHTQARAKLPRERRRVLPVEQVFTPNTNIHSTVAGESTSSKTNGLCDGGDDGRCVACTEECYDCAHWCRSSSREHCTDQRHNIHVLFSYPYLAHLAN